MLTAAASMCHNVFLIINICRHMRRNGLYQMFFFQMLMSKMCLNILHRITQINDLQMFHLQSTLFANLPLICFSLHKFGVISKNLEMVLSMREKIRQKSLPNYLTKFRKIIS